LPVYPYLSRGIRCVGRVLAFDAHQTEGLDNECPLLAGHVSRIPTLRVPTCLHPRFRHGQDGVRGRSSQRLRDVIFHDVSGFGHRGWPSHLPLRDKFFDRMVSPQLVYVRMSVGDDPSN